MKNKLSISLFVIFMLSVFTAKAYKSNLDSINYYLKQQSNFNRIKENRILKLKDSVFAVQKDPLKLYTIYSKLYDEYRSYVYDSAYVYVEKLIEISENLHDKDKITSSKVKQGFSLLSAGLFSEASEILNGLNLKGCSDETRAEYYQCVARLYYDMADFNKMTEFREKYIRQGNIILDSALQILPENSKQYLLALGLKKMKSNDYPGAISTFQRLLENGGYSQHENAIATSSVAYLYSLQGNNAESKNYLIEAVIADIKSSTKETVALRNLAQILYNERDIRTSVDYMRQALKDAVFYNARHRQLEIGNILPIIEGERVNIIEKQRDRVIFFIVLISILLVALIIALGIIWKSFKKLSKAKKEIQATNENLVDANRIKHEYIGYFFNQNAEFVEKLGFLERWVNKKIVAKQFDELKKFPQNLDVEKEREALYERFDQIFLKIFPNFVDEFNKLLKPEEQIQLKPGELLNPDLRICALIRLGINENEKIAHFLNYSVNTIYAYKTKIKGKLAIPATDLNKKLMEIKSY